MPNAFDWTDERTNQLVALMRGGATDRRAIASALGCGRGALNGKIARLQQRGAIAGPINHSWSPAELRRLREMHGQRRRADIARLLGRSLPSVQHQIRQLSLPNAWSLRKGEYRKKPSAPPGCEHSEFELDARIAAHLCADAREARRALMSGEARAYCDHSSHMCRWPIGDPLQPDAFGLCSRPRVAGKSYCETHQIRALAPDDETPNRARRSRGCRPAR